VIAVMIATDATSFMIAMSSPLEQPLHRLALQLLTQ
jgi:hypothetical protein